MKPQDPSHWPFQHRQLIILHPVLAGIIWRLICRSIHHQFHYLTVHKVLLCIYMNRYTRCWGCNVRLTNPLVGRRRSAITLTKTNKGLNKEDMFAVCAPVVMCSGAAATSSAQIFVLNNWQISPSLHRNTFTLCFCLFVSLENPGDQIDSMHSSGWCVSARGSGLIGSPANRF